MEGNCCEPRDVPAVQVAEAVHVACPTCGTYKGRQYVEALRSEHA